MAVLANVALTNTFDTWRLRTNALLTRVNQYTINESALYANTLTANVRFVSAGSTRLGTTGSNRTIINGLLTANGNLNVSGNTTISGNITINGGINLGDAATDLLTVTGRATIGQNLTVSGNTVLGGASKTLTIGGAGATSNATGWFGVTGRQSISTNLFVGGNTATAKATVTNLLTVSGNTSLGGASKTLTFGGSSATANLTGWIGITGRASVSTNLFVGGNTTINGTTTDRSNALSQTLTDGVTISWDTSLGRVATVTLGGARTLAAPTNLKVGTYILNVLQDATGSRTITWNTVFKWTGGVAPVLTTTANARDVFSFFSDGTNLYGSYLPDVK
jgi:hypothetical protein